MIKLSKSEEQLMEYIWQKEKSFMKDLIDCYSPPKPASTTVATLLKRMTDKGVIGYQQYGNSREYYPLIKKADYFSKHVNNMIKDYFDDSVLQFASFFTKATKLTKVQLEELKKIIDAEIQKKKK
ncbi:MAG TPA: BlaI/MecI/CopY family transcriptional regulator [Niabella sp.]|nr:BlaI/MecI/CopY family transcriptional regulator [Niabella sp.]HQW14968.1 BlaI/MecI/CopY family transcriptional regulator [Niabella sp.]HQX20140.1 BlaI/MecI/CopY family transcriptional regulator [Niabella sp.]HRB06745.1 BlaI/MecI/CopY family transcriptional regulator [Niabella sp.]HRB27586.1 BlaI/MecI/CopY family transcriptional regulator [Niabella sp.]